MEKQLNRLIAIDAQIEKLENERDDLMGEISTIKANAVRDNLKDLQPLKDILSKYKKITPDRWYQHETTSLSFTESTGTISNYPEFAKIFTDEDQYRRPAFILSKKTMIPKEDCDILARYGVTPTLAIVHTPGGN